MLDRALAWLSDTVAGRNLIFFAAGYLTATVITILLAIVILAALPVTYFRDDGTAQPHRSGGALRGVVRLARNVLGLVLVVLGFVLSLPAIPGQGVLTMLIGLILMDFPGKRPLELRLAARPRVFATMNRVRAWLGRPPLVR